MTEVIVAGHETHLVVEAALRDESVRETSATLASDQLRSQLSRPLPETRLGVENGELGELQDFDTRLRSWVSGASQLRHRALGE